jgi:hypothetical protein
MQIVDLKIDVTEAAGLSEPAWIAATVHLPDPSELPAKPVVCFAKPGGLGDIDVQLDDLHRHGSPLVKAACAAARARRRSADA